MITGSIYDRSYRSGDSFEPAPLEEREMQYLYQDGDGYVFMDNDNFEQLTINKSDIGDGIKWLMENMNIQVLMYQSEIMGVEMPNFVELLVVDTEPGIKGDTATGATKSAKLESGASVQVPLFVNTGDRLRIDTRTGEYMERA